MNIEELSIATIRSLCIDVTNKAKSGHPGMAIGSAPILYTLFTKHLNATPKNSLWCSRDRFVLSAGHVSALLYSMLHLCGYNISLDDLKSFRQLGSKTPGHPEFRWTDGVDATSGPLGQGIAQAAGMALAEEFIKNSYPEGDKLMNHYTYVLCGDGCLHEGISQEAISFAGHQKLNKLILLCDANNITLDGALDMSFSEDLLKRFEASEWNTIEVKDGNNVKDIDAAIYKAKKSDKPTFILIHTIIGFGAPKQGTNKVHGSPLGVEDGKIAKLSYGFDHDDFFVPEEVREHFKETFNARGDKAYSDYLEACSQYEKAHPSEYKQFVSLSGLSLDSILPDIKPDLVEGSSNSTRVASGKALNAYMEQLPNLIGGSADVAGSVQTKLVNGSDFKPNNRTGHNICFGIREFAMASIQNGALLHGGVRTYIGSFFVFSDYMKAAIRMAALSRLPAIYLFSHDSIAVGEDGPTHQPVEHLAMLRSIPNMRVIRPCDERETFAAWRVALKSTDTPTALIISRQGLPLLTNSSDSELSKGAYVISPASKKAELTLIATGSEVSLAIQAQQKLLEDGIDVKVVSMPSWELFEEQSESYKDSILELPWEKRVSVEMLSTFGWAKYAKNNFGFDTFGASAPAKDVLNHFGFNVDTLVSFCKNIKR